MIAGSGRVCTEVIEQSGRRTLVKSGAAGVFTAALQEQGLGIALKMDDGNGDAAAVAMLEILRQLGGLHADELARLEAFCRVPSRNTLGVVTGYLQAAVT